MPYVNLEQFISQNNVMKSTKLVFGSTSYYIDFKRINFVNLIFILELNEKQNTFFFIFVKDLDVVFICDKMLMNFLTKILSFIEFQ